MPLIGTRENVKPHSVAEASMTPIARHGGRGNIWRIIGWGAAVMLLTTPFVAMQIHAEGVHWSAADFIFAALFLGSAWFFRRAGRQSSSSS